MQGKGLEWDKKLKFKLSFFGKDAQKKWAAGKERGGKYWYFDKNNDNFQLESINYQWNNTQSINPDFLGKWKIDLKSSIESGFAKINPKIRKRIDKQLSRDCYTNTIKYGNKSLEIEIKEKDGLIQILGCPSYTIFWLKNLDDCTMACFTDYHPNHSFDIMEDDALLTLFKLDKNKKNLIVYNPWIVHDVCVSIGLDWNEEILSWQSWTFNWEYHKLKPYFQENSHIIATKLD